MKPLQSPPIGSVVSEIRGVYLFERGAGADDFVAYSPPGHLIHLVIAGEVRQRCSGREYHLRRGDLLWYHDGESVEGNCLRTPWKFYSVVFNAPSLPPPDFADRLARPAYVAARETFGRLLKDWNDATIGEITRALRCHATLAELILLHRPSSVRAPQAAADEWLVRLWWNIENQTRQNLGRAWSLADLADLGNTSPATVHRASMAAVKMPPVRRVKKIRLEMAKGLLLYSKESITRIAELAGYERINEFSRDMRAMFGKPPSKLRIGNLK